MNVRCAAPGGTDTAEGHRLRHGQEADVDPDANRRKIDAGLLAPVTGRIAETVDEVLAWVAGDPGRARAALSAELAKRRPRSTLITQLEQLGEAEHPTEEE